MSRAWPLPDGATSLMVLGDLHIDVTAYNYDKRAAMVTRELERGPITDGDCVYRVCVGDFVESGTFGNALAFMNGLTALDGVDWTGVSGNHDQDGRTRATACAALGLPEFVDINLGFARLLGLSPSPNQKSGGDYIPPRLDTAELDWLDGKLTEYADDDCWIVCHYPLMGTCRGPIAGTNPVYDTIADSTMHVVGPNDTDDTEVRAVLAAHDNAKVWLCGHTHNPADSHGMVIAEDVGGRELAHINASAIAYTGRAGHTLRGYFTEVRAPILTKNGDAIEVRWFDYAAGCYVGAGSPDRVLSITPT